MTLTGAKTSPSDICAFTGISVHFHLFNKSEWTESPDHMPAQRSHERLGGRQGKIRDLALA